MEALDDATHSKVLEHCAEGDRLAAGGSHCHAICEYETAWELLPEPRSDWEAATWILGAIGDAARSAGWLDRARRALDDAMRCPGAVGNPFLHLRRGQVLHEQGELDAAADELMRAYMGAGPEIFDDEPPRYLAFLRTRALLT